MDSNSHLFMQRALELAQKGLGKVSPNPMVGCVIVHSGKIIGEGYHEKYGEVHAEVNAINSVKNKSLLSQATLYVTLEPCSHHGKTPPCSDLIIKHQIPNVVICNADPFPEVNGKGIDKLKNSGVNVTVALLEKEGLALNKRFLTNQQKQRPYIILKWAQTKDGFVARDNFDSKWISNPDSRKLVHKWRSEEDSILVGYNTAKHDNPSLTVREWEGRNPVRIVLDKKLGLDTSLNLLDGEAKTIVFNEIKNDKQNPSLIYKQIDFKNCGVEVLQYLQQAQIGSLFIEGGANTLNYFIKNNLWDEARVFESDVEFTTGIAAPCISTTPVSQNQISNDTLTIYYNT